MSEQKADKPSKLDRWHQKPVRAGFVRGTVKNIRRSETVSPYGPALVVDFDLWTGPNEPLIPIRMTGTDFQNRIIEDNLLDIPDPDPTQRPIEPWRVTHALNDGHVIIAHYPGREFMMKTRPWYWTAGMMLLPIALLALALAYILPRLH